MALVQDRKFLINQIRAQYLSIADNDQSRRIIRRFSLDNEDTEYPTQEINEDYELLLERVESPPIPINVLEENELSRKLHLSNEQVNTIIHESDEEDTNIEHEPKQNTLEAPVMIDPHKPESKNSVSTIKLDQHDHDITPQAHQDEILHDSLTPQITQTSSHMGKMLPKISYKPQFTKLFRNSSESSSNKSTLDSKKRERKKPKDDITDDDDDDDDEYEDDEDDEDLDNDELDSNNTFDESDLYSETTSDRTDNRSRANTGGSELVNLEDIDGSNISRRQDENGILVDQNYSDVNTTSQLAEQFNDSKYLYGDNSISSVDDQLLLDSDFSDEDEDDIIDNARLQLLHIKEQTGSVSGLKLNNRKLSFEKQSRPKLRNKRSSSLSMKSNEITPNDNLRPIRSSSNFSTTSSSMEPSLSSSNFEKTTIIPSKLKLTSQLTMMINKKNNVSNIDPLEYYVFVSGESISNRFDVINMTVYLPNEETMKLKIRKTVTVVETIGFILLNIVKTKPELLSSSNLLKNPNKWSLHLIDDDGEPYEGSFGLMDRTKIISSYGEDEVAIIEVNDSEFQLNEIKTPQPILETESNSNTPSPSKGTNSNTIKQRNYSTSIIPKIDNDIKDAASWKLQVYKYPASQDASYTGIELPLTAKLNEILIRYTKIKDLDPTDYHIKVVGEDYILDLNDSISSLDGSYRLEVLTKRKARELNLRKKKILDNRTLPTINSNLTPQSLLVTNDINKDINEQRQQDEDEQLKQQQLQVPQRPSISRRHSLSSKQFSSSFTKHGISSSFKNKNGSKTTLKNPDQNNSNLPPNIVTNEYQKYTVWRRLPMKFINRHERSFAIDGEYVYIMPKDEKIWYENSFKTRTFHVSQIVSCKVSKRIPANFKIVVMKTNGPKRYDFEALNPQESLEIISKLHKLMEVYKNYHSSLS
ncbi:Target of rapamycin complex 2 subunit [Wickerhamomyces ciferrii]|uniref:Target of rapamycin complex 2 subunit n=1 Tax=Wickerhamomyces ciferrii (strain ATCC 14091 / BCRC 22168 / CBS 111 / JCM 3599 / NBRC 0793 / NRRL Y-1031 F-60-10) TaxID=1206466 RepID=K0KIH3_WICCF|nr:Target of rapamycin complex 2 subunit [Wickerhamomyces ciferrii]CCH42771.1 Target of rapamycin complex 2 subunit [Wickerhamomyces ciferrii]